MAIDSRIDQATTGNPCFDAAELIAPQPLNETPADSRQVGGQHYRDMTVQPWVVMETVLTPAEFIGFLKGSVIKYSMRQGRKGADDAQKALHHKQKLQEFLLANDLSRSQQKKNDA